MQINNSKKSFQELLQEEQYNLLSEINEKVKTRKLLMNPDSNYNIDHGFDNKS